jgi:hypothetical protein
MSGGSTSSSGGGGGTAGGSAGTGGSSGSTSGDSGVPFVPLADAGVVGDAPTLVPAPPPGALCSRIQDPDGLDVWSDARGPFVVVSASASGAAAVLQRESGTWKDLYRAPASAELGVLTISGFPSGDIVVGGYYGCGTLLIHAGVGACNPGFVPDNVFAVSDNRAYSMQQDRVLVYDGSLWTQYLDPFEPGPVVSGAWGLWADAQTVAVAVLNGAVYMSKNGAPFTETGFPDVAKVGPVIPEPDRYPCIWGFGGANIWVGTRQGGLYSYDGTAWSLRATILDSGGRGPRGMWGQSDVLYVHTDHQILRVRNGTLELLADFPGTVTLRGIWGTSLSEVYVVANDDSLATTNCGGAVLFEIDGTNIVRI